MSRLEARLGPSSEALRTIHREMEKDYYSADPKLVDPLLARYACITRSSAFMLQLRGPPRIVLRKSWSAWEEPVVCRPRTKMGFVYDSNGDVFFFSHLSTRSYCFAVWVRRKGDAQILAYGVLW